VWDLATGNFLRTLEGHTKSVRSVAVTADGKVVSASSDKTLKVWNLASSRLCRTPEGHTESVSWRGRDRRRQGGFRVIG